MINEDFFNTVQMFLCPHKDILKAKLYLLLILLVIIGHWLPLSTSLLQLLIFVHRTVLPFSVQAPPSYSKPLIFCLRKCFGSRNCSSNASINHRLQKYCSTKLFEQNHHRLYICRLFALNQSELDRVDVHYVNGFNPDYVMKVLLPPPLEEHHHHFIQNVTHINALTSDRDKTKQANTWSALHKKGNLTSPPTYRRRWVETLYSTTYHVN